MKNSNSPKEAVSPYNLSEVGEFAVLRYQPGINFKMLLSIFGIPESKTDTVRILMTENNIMPVNGDLRSKMGTPIVQGTIIKLHKKHLSQKILQSIG